MDVLEGKVAVVTGAASGMGLAIARRLAAEGARVLAADIDDDRLAVAVAGLREAGLEVSGVPTDVGSRAGIEALAVAAARLYDAPDIVCNNAGTVSLGSAWETSLEDWERVIRVNLWSVIHSVRTFIPGMIERGSPAHFTSTSSMAGLLPMATIAPYDASKAGIVAVHEALDQELRGAGHDHVEVSVLCPGSVVTGMSPPELSAPSALQPEDVAEMVLAAIRERRFWILTQPLYFERLREHVERTIDGRPPEFSLNL